MAGGVHWWPEEGKTAVVRSAYSNAPEKRALVCMEDVDTATARCSGGIASGRSATSVGYGSARVSCTSVSGPAQPE